MDNSTDKLYDILIEKMGGDLSKIIIDSKDKYTEDTPDLSTMTSGYSKIYKNKMNTQQKQSNHGQMMNRQFGNRY